MGEGVIVGVGEGVILGVGVTLGVDVGPNKLIVWGGRLHAPKSVLSHRISKVFLKFMAFLILSNDGDVNLRHDVSQGKVCRRDAMHILKSSLFFSKRSALSP